jgi:hypothetical protein
LFASIFLSLLQERERTKCVGSFLDRGTKPLS